MFRHLATLILAAVFLIAGSHIARADDDASRFDGPIGAGHATTAKKVVVVSLFGASAVAIVTALVFLAEANGAESDRQDLVRRNGGNPDQGLNGRQCTTFDQCNELADVKHRRDAAVDRAGNVLVGAAVGGLLPALTLLLVWPNGKKEASAVRVVPTAMSHRGGGLLLEGRF